MKNMTFRKSVTALAVTATLGFPALVAAQENGADDVERIQVTGSRIKRTDTETASPITVFDAEAIENSGFTSMEKFIHNIPSMNGGYNGSNTNNGSVGYASANLRGLGSSRTLLLINGRRFASGDLNSIPMAYIERVEVLRDGASTIYGSDAIAGVINFITKKDFEGAEFSAQYDLTGEGDGETTKVSAVIGATSDKGNVTLALEYQNRNTIWQGDRDFSRVPLSESGGELVSGGSSTIPYGSWSAADPDSQYNSGNAGTSFVVDPQTGEVRPYDGQQDAYNFAPASYMVTPQDVFSINASANYELTRDLNAFMEGGFTNRQSDQLMAAEGTFWGPTVAADHPDNPIGEDTYIYRRLEETGGRSFTQDFSDYRMVFGLEGYLDNGWSWDVSYNYARYVDTRVEYGRANPERFGHILDPALCNNEGVNEGCPGLWNPFEAGTLSQELMDYVLVPNSPVDRATTKQLMANLTGDTGSFSLPAGPISWAVGFEKRWEEYQNQPDGGAILGQIYSVAAEPTEGSYDVQEAYLEINAPLLAGLPGVERLDLSAAVRRSDYDFLSAQTTTKFGLEYVPADGMLLRATFAEGFRAPGIGNLYSPQVESNISYTDPCINYGSGSQSQTVKDNCASEGLPGDFSLDNNQSSTLVGGNPDLEPETSESFTVGMVYQPEFIENFSIAVDYYDIEIEDGLGAPSTSAIIAQCYNSPDFSSASCGLILGPEAVGRPGYSGSDYRDSQGYMAGILAGTANISTFTTSGFDYDINWSTDLGDGMFNMRVDGTFLDEYTYLAQEGGDVLELAGMYGADTNFGGRVAAFPEVRTNFTFGYQVGNWDLNWITRYQGSVEDINYSEDDLSSEVGSYFYHDAQVNYFVTENTTFTLGARNLFDKKPPYVTNNNDMNTLNSSYDTAGQYLYARFGVKF
ncbi:MAG: TonB-dependent receptor [Idiomarinaceae bacterium]|uniref:TonB-dependent receptor plug domain-containing protein n=1 Tax=Idiomarina sp. 28-8 TaxID=1260624 RepID=UPI0002D78CDC|nr:TonB-dependent receptor [Idiomarina sp. 28-8]NWO02232.1 TonB-dependent receptor [Idiomarinaceae bacterium]